MNASGHHRATVALAEDNLDQRRMMVAMLSRLGFQVACAASNGAELIEWCSSHEPVDVALVDLEMPEVDGLEAAEVVARRGIPVVLITGLPDAEHIVLEHEPICVRLLKPVTIEAIEKAIQTALATKAGRRRPSRR